MEDGLLFFHRGTLSPDDTENRYRPGFFNLIQITMKEKIRESVKTAFSKYGLKDSSIEKLVNIVENKISAMGTIENEDEVIKSEVAFAEPYIAIIQPEIDALRNKVSTAKTEVTTSTSSANVEAENALVAEIKRIREKQEQFEQQYKSFQKQSHQEQVYGNIRKAALTKDPTNQKSGWASNSGVLDMVLATIKMDDTDTEETIFQKCQAEYNKRFVEIFGKSDSVPGVGNGGGASEISAEERAKAIAENQQRYRNQQV